MKTARAVNTAPFCHQIHRGFLQISRENQCWDSVETRPATWQMVAALSQSKQDLKQSLSRNDDQQGEQSPSWTRIRCFFLFP